MSKKTSKFLFKGKKKNADFDFALGNNLGKKIENSQNSTNKFTNDLDNISNLDSLSFNLVNKKEKNFEGGNLQTNLTDLSQKIDFIKKQRTQLEKQNEEENIDQNEDNLEFNFQVSKNYDKDFKENFEKELENKNVNTKQNNDQANSKTKIEAKKFDIFNFLKPKKNNREIEKEAQDQNTPNAPNIGQNSQNKLPKRIEKNQQNNFNILQKNELNDSFMTNLELSNFEDFENVKGENIEREQNIVKNEEQNSNSSLQNNFDFKKFPNNLKNNQNQLVNSQQKNSPNSPNSPNSQINEKIPKPKTFKENIGDGELRLLLTTHSIQEEIDQHLAPKDEYENVLLTDLTNEAAEKNIKTRLEDNCDEFAEFEYKNNQNNNQNKKQNINFDSNFDIENNKTQQQNLPFGSAAAKNISNQINPNNLKPNSQNNSQKFTENSDFKINSNQNSQKIPISNKFQKRNIENSEDNAKFVIARQNYQKEQKKSQFNLILKIISFGCILAVLLFYFQGLQPLILSQITQKNQEKIIKLSQIFQVQVGSYFEITQDLNTKIQPDSDQKCTQNYTDSQMNQDSQKIEDLINNKLKTDKNMENPEKYWNFGSEEISKEYLQTVSRYTQSLEIYKKKSDYLVDYLYFLLQRNSWQEICQNIKNTNSLKRFEEICSDWKNLNEKYKRERKSEFFDNINTIITSFDTNCNELNNTQSPSEWRENWLEKYKILIKTLPSNDNSKLYQMNEQTLTEFQTRSRNIWTIYEQKTRGIGNLYLLNLEK